MFKLKFIWKDWKVPCSMSGCSCNLFLLKPRYTFSVRAVPSCVSIWELIFCLWGRICMTWEALGCLIMSVSSCATNRQQEWVKQWSVVSMKVHRQVYLGIFCSRLTSDDRIHHFPHPRYADKILSTRKRINKRFDIRLTNTSTLVEVFVFCVTKHSSCKTCDMTLFTVSKHFLP